jgi:hypothetical protein
MIASDKNLVTIKPIEDIEASARHCYIAEVIDLVSGLDDSIPPPDHFFISLFHGRPWT